MVPIVERRDRYKYKVYTCRAHIRALSVPLWAYCDNTGSFPDTLERLLKHGYVKEDKVLKCPANNHYYICIATKHEKERFPMIRDEKGNHPGTINVLMSDTTVLTVPDDIWEEAVAEYIRDYDTSRYIPYQEYPPKK